MSNRSRFHHQEPAFYGCFARSCEKRALNAAQQFMKGPHQFLHTRRLRQQRETKSGYLSCAKSRSWTPAEPFPSSAIPRPISPDHGHLSTVPTFDTASAQSACAGQQARLAMPQKHDKACITSSELRRARLGSPSSAAQAAPPQTPLVHGLACL